MVRQMTVVKTLPIEQEQQEQQVSPRFATGREVRALL